MTVLATLDQMSCYSDGHVERREKRGERERGGGMGRNDLIDNVNRRKYCTHKKRLNQAIVKFRGCFCSKSMSFFMPLKYITKK